MINIHIISSYWLAIQEYVVLTNLTNMSVFEIEWAFKK